MGSRLDMTDSGDRVAQVRQGFDLGCAEDARCPTGNTGAKSQNSPTLADTVQIHNRHGRFHGAAHGGNGDPGAELQLPGDGTRRRQGYEGRAVDLGGKNPLEAEALILLGQSGQFRGWQHRQNSPEFPFFSNGVRFGHGSIPRLSAN